ncbi:uncharacterized protein LOC129919475 [Episyrphus balteatus]|uniref:uncharacterized protein LOC129919475 n=1 Tax=Episyrphus balteatus TaxID=286459 RepID=UPI002486B7A7|nr:uncharacterized protein LOC129919475 [Episyrphus balteatus]
MWDNICRLCSSRGDYDIFTIIPSYLHASPNEFLLWQQPINKLLEETTGLSVNEDDGLPQKMCALCISYLKHAATFRHQAINNAISLKAVATINGRCKNSIRKRAANMAHIDSYDDKASVLITANDLIYSEERKTDTNTLVNILNNQSSKLTKNDDCMKKLLQINDNKLGTKRTNNRGNHSDDLVPGGDDNDDDVIAMTYLNLLFEKDTNSSARKMKRLAHHQKPLHRRPVGENNLAAIFDELNNTSDPLGEEFQTASSDENEAFEQKKNFFSYKEKNFEEDDVMDLDELKEANITINIPETCKERKCRACFRRFMFEESYKEHMDMCIEYKFLLFIEEINRLLDIRRSKAVSPHEFIRRMIFCLRKTCQWLKSSCGEILLPDLLVNGEAKKRLDSDGKNSTAEISSGGNSDETTEKFAQEGNKTVIERKKSLTDILKQDAESLIVPGDDTKATDAYLQFFKNSAFSKSTPEKRSTTNEKPGPLGQNIGVATTTTTTDESDSLNKSVRKISQFENILNLIDGPSIGNSNSNFSYLLHNIEKDQLDDSQVGGLGDDHSIVRDEKSDFFEKLKNASLLQFQQQQQQTPPKKKPLQQQTNDIFPLMTMKFSARCNTCNTVFESVASLEEHNANFHNNQTAKVYDEHKKIISLFEDDNDDDEDDVDVGISGGSSKNHF